MPIENLEELLDTKLYNKLGEYYINFVSNNGNANAIEELNNARNFYGKLNKDNIAMICCFGNANAIKELNNARNLHDKLIGHDFQSICQSGDPAAIKALGNAKILHAKLTGEDIKAISKKGNVDAISLLNSGVALENFSGKAISILSSASVYAVTNLDNYFKLKANTNISEENKLTIITGYIDKKDNAAKILLEQSLRSEDIGVAGEPSPEKPVTGSAETNIISVALASKNKGK
ncbi:MAG TPA: hypothetical protein DIV86_07800 [Alphaproteobacteria bacterium]|nr:hypothetical protein [Alphaproteobacteria bacterium]